MGFEPGCTDWDISTVNNFLAQQVVQKLKFPTSQVLNLEWISFCDDERDLEEDIPVNVKPTHLAVYPNQAVVLPSAKAIAIIRHLLPRLNRLNPMMPNRYFCTSI